MKETRVTFPSGSLTLEGVLNFPESAGPRPAVIVCHPHPLYGGSMDNNVVDALGAALVGAGIIVFKFNFRGVGASQGSYGGGIGEGEDVDAALTFVSGLGEVAEDNIGLAGYSAGAGFGMPVGVADGRVKALAAISPPLSMFDFAPLKDCAKPKFLISGSTDDFTDAGSFLDFCRNLAVPREYGIMQGADHFWWGYDINMAARVAAFFTSVLLPCG